MNVNYRHLLRLVAAVCVLLVAAVGSPGHSRPTAVLAPTTVPPSPVAAAGPQTADQMAQLWDQFRTTQLKATQLTAQTAKLKAQIAAETAKRAQLQSQISSYTTQIQQAEVRRAADAAQLSATDRQLVALEASIGDTTGKASDLKSQVQARTIDLYKKGPSSYLGLLLSAHSFRDFLSRLNFLGGVVSSDRSKLTGLEQLNAQLGQQKGQATQRRTDVAAAKAAVEAESAKITGLRAGVSQASRTLAAAVTEDQTAVGQVQELLKEVEAEKATYVAAMAKLAGESSSITAMLRARQINQTFSWAGKKVIWPVTGPISSPFGPRTSPIFGTPEFHTGLDIAVDYGIPVKAAEAGQVVSSGLMEGYGNVVIIDHGGALATLYAHMSSLSVRAGQTVTKGQVVGAIGCTGLCTGPHLHFETRIGGTPVQPLGLLP
jgi:murein DD-endopeptidase MepM/ murein hydrolase activator NlpD